MLVIKVPATTSNFAVGFDALGMALDIYNTFGFEINNSFLLEGFDKNYEEDNLVLKSYLAFCKENGLTDNNISKVKIKLLNQDIPIARGLGSSATCIIAGIIAANKLNNLNKTLYDCACFASQLEGHPDNAFNAVYGGLNVIVKDDKYYWQKLEVDESIKFALLVPNTLGKTEELREGLPKEVSLNDAVYHLSRMGLLPNAFKDGDFELLKVVLKDRIHEDYRGLFIPRYLEVKKHALDNDQIMTISGSGPSLLIIAKDSDFSSYEAFNDTFRLLTVKPSQGLILEEKR
jgi:homoserine kinase